MEDSFGELEVDSRKLENTCALGGNRISHEEDVRTPTAEILLVKILLNSCVHARGKILFVLTFLISKKKVNRIDLRAAQGGRISPPCPCNHRTRVSASSDLVSNFRSPQLGHWRFRPLPPLLLPWTGLVLHCTTSFVGVASRIYPVRDDGARPATNSWTNLLMMNSGMGRWVIAISLHVTLQRP